MRHFRPRAYGAMVGAVALTILAAACTSSTSSSGQTTQALAPGWQGLNPGTEAPQYGGTLNMVGISDVDVMDYDIGYYRTDFEVLRLTVRQLYSWPAIPGQTLTLAPDLATGMPVITDHGLKQTVTSRSGRMWNTSPPRPVTAQDLVRGIKRACNPSPNTFGGMADFESTIKGLTAYCSGYPAAAATSAAVMKQYNECHNVSGIAVSGNSITFTLTRPAPWLIGAMTLPPFSAVPIEAETGLPGSPQVYGHMYSDGPYEITSYTPDKSITFARNPQWKASTDPLRKAYVNAINVDETGRQATIYQEMATGTPSLGMSFDALVPPAAYPQLLNLIKSGSQLVNLSATYQTNPYLVFNTVSPDDGGALGKVAVRQALCYGIERSQLIKTLGGTAVNIPLTHVLPPGTDGAQDVPSGYDPYPYNPGKAKSMLAAAGFTASHPLTLKLLYRSDSQGNTKVFTNRQPAECAGLSERDRRAHQRVGLLRQIPSGPQQPRQPVTRVQGHLGPGGAGLRPGLVRGLGGDLVQRAFLEPGRVHRERRRQLRLLLQRGRQPHDQPGAEPVHRGAGRRVLGEGRRGRDAGGGDLPDHRAAAAGRARTVRAQRRVHDPVGELRPGERLAQQAGQLTAQGRVKG